MGFVSGTRPGWLPDSLNGLRLGANAALFSIIVGFVFTLDRDGACGPGPGCRGVVLGLSWSEAAANAA